MNNINNIILKEYLLKAYNVGFNDGCSAESDARDGFNYQSEEYKEVNRNEIIQTLQSSLIDKLQSDFEYQIQIAVLNIKREGKSYTEASRIKLDKEELKIIQNAIFKNLNCSIKELVKTHLKEKLPSAEEYFSTFKNDFDKLNDMSIIREQIKNELNLECPCGDSNPRTQEACSQTGCLMDKYNK